MLALPAIACVGCSSVPWRYDLDGALRSAAQQRRRAVILFTTGTSADGRDMDFRTFTDAKVVEMMREFVPIRLDYYMYRAKADQLGVTQAPTMVVIRPDGTIAGSQSGKLKPEDLRLFLIKNRFN